MVYLVALGKLQAEERRKDMGDTVPPSTQADWPLLVLLAVPEPPFALAGEYPDYASVTE